MTALPPDLEKVKRRQLIRKNKLNLDQWHHWFNKEYGYIPYNEFYQMPWTIFYSLASKLSADWENERKEMEKSKRRLPSTKRGRR